MQSLHGTRIRWFLAGFAASVFVAPLMVIVLSHTIESGLVVVTHPGNGSFHATRPRSGLITVNIGSFARPSRVCFPSEDELDTGEPSISRAHSLRQALEYAERGLEVNDVSVLRD